ncbi:hypothetical protein BMR11_11025, partial [Methylococcaceae bacterium CS5]
MLRSQHRVYDGSGEVARTQDVWGAEGISGRVKFLPLAWAGMPKTSFRKNSDSPLITTLDKVTISAIAGSAGAGGAILPLATDKVFVREGVILNPHYKNMGQLFGSEYWTYLLPKRVGEKMAASLSEEQRLPISAKKAWHIGFVDKVLDKNHKIFVAQVK